MLGPATPNPNIIKFNEELEHVRKTFPHDLAQEIVNAQPMHEAREAWIALYNLLQENPGCHLEIRANPNPNS